MSTLLTYFWPIASLGLALGAVSGLLALRRRRRSFVLVGIAAALAGAALWHGPLGAAERLAAKVEGTARFVLEDWEMGHIRARLHRGPLTRRLVLSGRADDFQRTELVRIIGGIPGAGGATWSSRSAGIALILEAALVSLGGFLVGLLLAYVVELRRRHNAQWTW